MAVFLYFSPMAQHSIHRVRQLVCERHKALKLYHYVKLMAEWVLQAEQTIYQTG